LDDDRDVPRTFIHEGILVNYLYGCTVPAGRG
jgi:hypothetical protein